MTRFRRSVSGDDTETDRGLVVPATEKVEFRDDDDASKLLLLPLDVIKSEAELEKDVLSNDIDGMVKKLVFGTVRGWQWYKKVAESGVMAWRVVFFWFYAHVESIMTGPSF